MITSSTKSKTALFEDVFKTVQEELTQVYEATICSCSTRGSSEAMFRKFVISGRGD